VAPATELDSILSPLLREQLAMALPLSARRGLLMRHVSTKQAKRRYSRDYPQLR